MCDKFLDEGFGEWPASLHRPTTSSPISALMVDDLEALRPMLEDVGVDIVVGQPLPGFERFYVSDPFGNRLEFLQPVGPMTGDDG